MIATATRTNHFRRSLIGAPQAAVEGQNVSTIGIVASPDDVSTIGIVASPDDVFTY